MSGRREAREAALQALFAVDVGRREPGEALTEAFETPAARGQEPFVKELVLGTLENAEASDAVIAPLLRDWTIDRLPTIDRLVLRMAVFEMTTGRTPRAVAINEAVELVKKYSTADSGRFVNGVLSRVDLSRA
ncbi:MAG TPA: transcription antitermination factor NusB [Candidatus Dormibacteraeota bacterium]|nr:transcription antitermination factor NusB [Candidatus Dormibacteraeota bacterium]